MDLSAFIKKAIPLRVLGVKVTQHDRLAAVWHSEDECRRNIYSATKSFTSCAVGFAVQEGLLSLDEKLTDAFPQELPETVSDNLARATVRDLLTMCLGQAAGSLMSAQRPFYREDRGPISSTTTSAPIWRGYWSSGAPAATWPPT